MSVTLTLNPEVERAIEFKAQLLGITPAEYLARLVEEAVPSFGGEHRTLADEVASVIGYPDFSTEGTENWSVLEEACDAE